MDKHEKDRKRREKVEEIEQFTINLEKIPNEVMSLIFSKLPPSEVLRVRETCRDWKKNIESLYPSNKHVLIYFKAGFEKDDLARRFFATHLKPFKKISIRASAYPTEDLSLDFCSTVSHVFLSRITKMFPKLEHLIVDTVLDNFSANALIYFLPTWTNLRTFAVFRAANLSKKVKLKLMEAIKQCPSIRRLGITDMGRNWWWYLPFGNISELAYESKDDISREIVARLTNNTFKFWTRINRLSPNSVENWVKDSPYFVEELEMLHLGDIVDEFNGDRGYVNVSSFKNLYVLRVQFEWCAGSADVPNSYIYQTLDPEIFIKMIGLSNLFKLELICFKLDIAATLNFDLRPLETVTQLRLNRFYARDTGDFDGLGFCTIVNRLFPLLEKLSLVVAREVDGEAIERVYRQFFPNLKQFELTVFAPAKSDSYIGYFEYYPE